MNNNLQMFIQHLVTNENNIKDIIKPFSFCSRYNNGADVLVDSKMETINFDKLSEWKRKPNKVHSADSLSFSGEYIYLIEFKSGDQTTHEHKLEKLIENVSGKINDSDETLSMIYDEISPPLSQRVKQRFCLVVDSKKMGIDIAEKTLIGLSLENNKDDKMRTIMEEVQPRLKRSIHNPDNYDNIDVWYSDLFDSYLETYNITDVRCYI